jgi:hypothetical protein
LLTVGSRNSNKLEMPSLTRDMHKVLSHLRYSLRKTTTRSYTMSTKYMSSEVCFHPFSTIPFVISCQELAEIIRSDKVPKKDYLVVDVRDDDFAGGNIVGAVNMPSRDFLMNVDNLVKDTKDVPVMVFHCALSQVRYALFPTLIHTVAHTTYTEDPKLQEYDSRLIPYD